MIGFNTSSTLITGIAFAVLALGFGSAYERTYGMGWVAAAIGVWAIVAPWVVSGAPDTTKVVLSNVITGAVAVLLGLVTTVMGGMERT